MFFSTLNSVKCVVSFCSELPRYDSSPDDSGSVTLNSYVLRSHAKFGSMLFRVHAVEQICNPYLLIEILFVS